MYPDIYFHQRNRTEHEAALALRDAVLRLRRDGAFVAVPLWKVNHDPIGPHPAGASYSHSNSLYGRDTLCLGSYEIWCPSESFVSVFSYLCMHRGELRYVLFSTLSTQDLIPYLSSILVHPLTREEVRN